MAYNSTNNLPEMSYEEYKRAMEKKRKASKKNDDLPEAFLKLFEKHNVEAPASAVHPEMEEEILSEEAYEEDMFSEEEAYEEAEEAADDAYAPAMSRRERRMARNEQADETADEAEAEDSDEDIDPEEAAADADDDQDVPLAGLSFIGKKLKSMLDNRKGKGAQEEALEEEYETEEEAIDVSDEEEYEDALEEEISGDEEIIEDEVYEEEAEAEDAGEDEAYEDEDEEAEEIVKTPLKQRLMGIFSRKKTAEDEN